MKIILNIFIILNLSNMSYSKFDKPSILLPQVLWAHPVLIAHIEKHSKLMQLKSNDGTLIFRLIINKDNSIRKINLEKGSSKYKVPCFQLFNKCKFDSTRIDGKAVNSVLMVNIRFNEMNRNLQYCFYELSESSTKTKMNWSNFIVDK